MYLTRNLWYYKVYLSELLHYFKLLCRYSINIDTDEDMEKMQFEILRRNHVIEKGLSMRRPRSGFGQQKVEELIGRLEVYYGKFGKVDKDFLRYPLDTIFAYIVFIKGSGVRIDGIEKRFNHLCATAGISPNEGRGGVLCVKRESVQRGGLGDFCELLHSRHSIRFYDKDEPIIQRAKIDRALELAQLTPSACNRQSWRTHVYSDEKCLRLIMLQGGCGGFSDEVQTAILVTANLKAFFWYELHQAYVDGGLYAMNLINALHYVGLATIPLSTGIDWKTLRGLKDFGIPDNEVPIMIIGVGNMPPEFRVAVSTRKSVLRTNTYHE